MTWYVQNQIEGWKQRVREQQHEHKQAVDALAAAAEMQMKELKLDRSREMDEVHAKIQDVLQRKNTTIQRYAPRIQ